MRPHICSMIECQSTYIISCMKKMIEGGSRSVECRKDEITSLQNMTNIFESCQISKFVVFWRQGENRAEALKKWLEYVYAECRDKVLYEKSIYTCFTVHVVQKRSSYFTLQVWTSGCMSYHMSEEGVVHNIWPRTVLEYWWRLLRCDMADLKMNGAPFKKENFGQRLWAEYAKHNKMNWKSSALHESAALF